MQNSEFPALRVSPSNEESRTARDKEGVPGREAVAKREVGHTEISPLLSRTLTMVFLLTIMTVPVVQYVAELELLNPGVRKCRLPRSMEALWIPIDGLQAFRSADGTTASRVFSANREILRSIHTYEESLEERSIVGAWLRLRVQSFLTGTLGAGNEQVYCGRDGWLFFRPAVDHLTMRGFLEDREIARRADSGIEWQEPPQPNPLTAIVEFRDQLSRRGIELLLVPIPVKAAIYPENLSQRFAGATEPVVNPSYHRFLSVLADHDVRVFDSTPLLWESKSIGGDAQYLRADTHWTPRAVDLVASGIAEAVREILGPSENARGGFTSQEVEVSREGDLAEMLEITSIVPPQTVLIESVHDSKGQLSRTDESAEILFLGDSFANIYSQEALGWGTGAGLAQRLSFHMQRPITPLIRNDDGAFATRLLLAKTLAHGRDMLANTRVVIWEFTSRELSFGDWRLVPMEDPPPTSGVFFVPERGASKVVEGTIAAIAEAPDPRSAPYADYIIGLHLVHLTSQTGLDGDQALVFTWAMKNRQLTAGAGYRIGQRIRLELRPWADVDEELGSFSRGELYDARLLFQPPCWGEERPP